MLKGHLSRQPKAYTEAYENGCLVCFVQASLAVGLQLPRLMDESVEVICLAVIVHLAVGMDAEGLNR